MWFVLTISAQLPTLINKRKQDGDISLSDTVRRLCFIFPTSPRAELSHFHLHPTRLALLSSRQSVLLKAVVDGEAILGNILSQ